MKIDTFIICIDENTTAFKCLACTNICVRYKRLESGTAIYTCDYYRSKINSDLSGIAEECVKIIG